MTHAERKARQRHADVEERRASAERVDAELVRVVRETGKRFSANRTIGRTRARSPFELSLAEILDRVAKSFPADERRRVFTRLGFDPASFLNEDGSLKDWPM